MKIETTPQLDFHNVLIRPKRTTISSRSQVDLEREILFPHSTLKWKGVPIISANMDTTGTFEVYDKLVKHKMITCFNKFYNLKNYQDKISKTGLDPNYFMISTGINEQGFCDLCQIVDATNCKWICIDVANGYMEQVVNFCKKVRATFEDKIIVSSLRSKTIDYDYQTIHNNQKDKNINTFYLANWFFFGTYNKIFNFLNYKIY